MFAYLIRRFFVGVVLLIAMSLVTFIMFFASPIDPAKFACGKICSPAQIAQTRKALGYDKPWPVQWKDFMVGIVKGREYPEDPALRKSAPQLISTCHAPCMGFSVVNQETVGTELKIAAPVSISVGILAFLIWLIGGIAIGSIAALTKGSFIDKSLVGTSLVLYAFPTFFIGEILYNIVSIEWGLYPAPSYTSIADGGVWTWFYNLVLPAITLAVFYMAAYVRMTRAFVLESMGEDYLRTAIAKGLPRRKILIKHTLRAALTPIVSMAGLDLASVLGGAIITETVFNYNGLGKLAVDATVTHDLPTLVGLVILLGAFVILANIIVDVLYAMIDPRVRLV